MALVAFSFRRMAVAIVAVVIMGVAALILVQAGTKAIVVSPTQDDSLLVLDENAAGGSYLGFGAATVPIGAFECPAYQPLQPAGGKVRTVASQAALDAALKLVQPGDVIELSSGTYKKLHWRKALGHAVGTAEKPIIIQSAQGAKPVFDAGNIDDNRGDSYSGFMTDIEHAKIRGLTFTNGYFGFRATSVSNVDFEYNTVHKIGDAAVAFLGSESAKTYSSDINIYCNEVYNTGLHDANRGEGFYIGTGSCKWQDKTHNVLIKGNRAHNLNGEAADIKCYTQNVTIEDNYFYDSKPAFGGAISLGLTTTDYPDANYLVQRNYIWNITKGQYYGQAIAVGHGTSTIRNNVIWSIGNEGDTRAWAAAIQVHTFGGPGGSSYGFRTNNAKDVYIYNNTVVGCRTNCINTGNTNDSIDPQVFVANNYVSKATTGVIAAESEFVAGATDYLCAVTDQQNIAMPGSCLAPKQTSKAINAAKALDGFSDSVGGAARPVGAAWDFGAFEQ